MTHGLGYKYQVLVSVWVSNSFNLQTLGHWAWLSDLVTTFFFRFYTFGYIEVLKMTKISQGNLKQLRIIFFNYYYFFWLEMLGAYLTNRQCQRHTCKKTLVMSCHVIQGQFTYWSIHVI